MVTVGRTFYMDDMEDEGPIAVRDFPVGCVKMPRNVGKNDRKRPVEANEGEGESAGWMLPDNFDKLSAREQFWERHGLYERLLKHYKNEKNVTKDKKLSPYLEAMKQMNKQGTSFNFEGLGHTPGVEVGDLFLCRTQIYVLGLHRVHQAGIACVKQRGVKIASSVVVSGGYQDDDDRGETIEYSGHGGNDYKGDKRQKKDQELIGGNRALFNSYERKNLVRVIRGHGAGTKIYSYDGLYTVTGWSFGDGTEGYKVYKFDLTRELNQPTLDTRKVSFNGQRPNRH